MFSERIIFLTVVILLIFITVAPVNVFAIGVQGTVGTPVTGGGGETPPPQPPPPPPPPTDTTPPVISNISISNITQSGADISWLTNESASTFVDYGLTSTYSSQAAGIHSTTTHKVSLVNLTAGTIYHYRVRSADVAGNETFSLDQIFETLAPTDATPPNISNIQAANITGDSASIIWNINEPADGSVDYGETTSYEIGSLSTSTLATSYNFVLQNLKSQTTYHFRVRSRDASGNTSTSADNTFTTKDITPPNFSTTPEILEITPTGATIPWATDELTTGIVFYRLSGAAQQQFSDKTLVKNHSVVLKGLVAGSDYLIYVRASDKAGNKTDSAVKTFKTLADRLPPANVSELSIKSDDRSLTLSWKNSPDADFSRVQVQRSTVGFPATPEEGKNVFTGREEIFTDSSLQNDFTYYYTVFTFDTSNNSSSGALITGVPTVPPPLEVPPEVPGAPPGVPPPGVPGEVPGAPPEVVAPPTEVVPPVPRAPPIVAPPITVPKRAKLKSDIFNFRTAGRTVSIIPSKDNTIKLGPRAFLSISIHSERLAGDPKRIVLNLMSSSYLFASTDGFFETGVYLPAASGKYPASIIIDYVDGASDVVDLTILIDPYGFVYEIRDGKLVKLAGTEVALFKLEAEHWQEWDAAVFGQINPQVTGDDGTFAFFVPAGTYYLRARHDGYRDNNTNRFDVIDTIVNINIELIATPKIPEVKVENTVKLLRAAPGILRFASRVAGQEVAQFADNPVVDEVNSRVAVPTVVAAAAINTVTAASAFNLWNYLQYLITQPLLLLRRRKRFGWGVVYNAVSRVPIDLAIVRLYQLINPVRSVGLVNPHLNPPPVAGGGEEGVWKLIQTRVTGKDGKFIFFVGPGKYKIEVSKQNFAYPTDYLKDIKTDEPYLNLYHGEIIEVTESKALTSSIPVDPVEEKLPAGKLLRQQIFRTLRQGLSLSGIVFSGASFAITPTTSVGLVMALHLLLYILLRRLAIPGVLRAFGIVYNVKTNEPLKAVIARIFETAYNKLLATQITDSAGRYAFLVGKNIYYITYDRANYESKKSEIIDLSNIREPQIVAPNVALKPIESGIPKPDAREASVPKPVIQSLDAQKIDIFKADTQSTDNQKSDLST